MKIGDKDREELLKWSRIGIEHYFPYDCDEKRKLIGWLKFLEWKKNTEKK